MKIRKASRRFGMAAVVLVCFGLSACNGLQTATRAQGIITAVLNVAAAEEPSVPAADQAAFTNWVNLGKTLDGQLSACITNVGGVTGKGAKFSVCFNTFASGLLSSSELAQLRVLSPGSTSKVQAVVTAIVTGVNVAFAAFGGSSLQAPSVGSVTAAGVHDVGIRAGLSSETLAQYGY